MEVGLWLKKMKDEAKPGEVYVKIRDFDPDKDQAFIYASWRNAAYYGSDERDDDAKGFFKRQTVFIRDVLKKATVLIACVEDAPEVLLGYAVFTGNHLHWVYVKLEFRARGIGAALVPKDIETVSPYLTKIGAVIVEMKKLKIKEN